MKKQSHYAVHTYINGLMISLMILLIGLITYNNHAASSLLRRRVYQNTEDTVRMYEKQLDQDLQQIRTYLYTLYFDNSSYSIVSVLGSGDSGRVQAMQSLRRTLQDGMTTHEVDSFFCYFPEDNAFVYNSADRLYTFQQFRNDIRQYLSTDTIDYRHWKQFDKNGESYLLLIIPSSNNYLGCRIKVSNFLDKIAEGETRSQLYLLDSQGCFLPHDENQLPLSLTESNSDFSVQNVNGKKYCYVTLPMQSGDFYLAQLIPYAEITGSSRDIIIIAFFVISCFFVIWILQYLFIQSKILRPIALLTNAIEKLKDGNLDHYVPSDNQPYEFHHLSQVFNDMLAEIQTLKIDIYEKKLNHQRLEIQYLKQQITPHFMINCLNMVYSLMDIGQAQLARQLLSALSVHLRYTLSSGQTVSLKREMEVAENYIQMSKIRYPNAIEYHCECEDGLEDATAIPLLLLNFIENAVKHEVVMGELLTIEIHITKELYQKEECLHICCWDSGSGYSRESLENLNNLRFRLQEETEHIGMSNVYQRAAMIYPIHDFIFSNRPDSGAQVDLYLSLNHNIPIERTPV